MYLAMSSHKRTLLQDLRELARTVNLRNTPEIKFILDQSIEYGINMSKLIDEVTQKDSDSHNK